MADVVDRTDERTAVWHDANIAVVRQKAAAIPKGEPGECRLCEEESQRLVNEVCAPCRDKYKLP